MKNGKTIPNIEQLQTLANLYKITISELIGEQTNIVIQENQNRPHSKAASHTQIQKIVNDRLEKIIEQKDIIIQEYKNIIIQQNEKISRRDKKIEELKKNWIYYCPSIKIVCKNYLSSLFKF